MVEGSVSRIFVRALSLDAFIGIYPHERARSQPLRIDIELTLDKPRFGSNLAETIDYDTLAAHARKLAAEHIDLIETFAERLADQCLANDLVCSVRVRVEKPDALPDAVAGVELIRYR